MDVVLDRFSRLHHGLVCSIRVALPSEKLDKAMRRHGREGSWGGCRDKSDACQDKDTDESDSRTHAEVREPDV